MARIRTVKPEFWSHPVLSKVEDETRLAALGLLNFADDEGYFQAAPGLIRSQLWPLDEDSTKARRVLAQLIKVGWIQVREHLEYGAIGLVVGFTKHQKIDRPSPSRIRHYYDSTNDRRALDERSLLDQGSGIRDQGEDQGVVPDPADQQIDDIMQTDQATSARVASEPMVYSWQDWRREHPRIGIARTGEDGDADAWRDLWKTYGRECFDAMYAPMINRLADGKKIWFSQAAEWLNQHTQDA